MNPRQRRGVLLMILAALGAVVVFSSVLGYVGSVRAEVGVKTEVLRLKQSVPAFTRVTEDNLERIWVPKKWSPTTMIVDVNQLEGKVAASDLPGGAYLQVGMLAPGPSLQPGQREIAILIDAETGVAGRVRKGMSVDIYATYQKQQGQAQQSCAARIVKSALVTQIGQVTNIREEKNSTVTSEALPITFALSAVDSLRLTREESFANKIRLALIGGSGQTPDGVKLPPFCDTQPAR
ncbi:Flp pilus assembly protein CpaB [Actinomadura hibisca]|uniref:Flp pilus assembly protein CpaB n=1 Tax=Actinomadura hibisca TaxID=68565 RepID=UPI000830A221|nr:Flp pilus assembly protein CpaB [Actinomadura hibisca]